MRKKRIIISTVNRYDPAIFGDIDLAGCNLDGDKVASYCQDHNIEIVAHLRDEDVTKENLYRAFEKLASMTKKGDRAAFFNSGHGTQVMRDGSKYEAILTHNSLIYDYEFRNNFLALLPHRSYGYGLFDTCHGGGMGDRVLFGANMPVSKSVVLPKDLEKAFARDMILADQKEVCASIAVAAGAQKNTLSYEGRQEDGSWAGNFTYQLLAALNDGKRFGSAMKFVINNVPGYQSPSVDYIKGRRRISRTKL